ncbi:MAG: ubiquinol-cytochrome c reductase iron-sulfur subunit [Anaerolineales bacterium]
MTEAGTPAAAESLANIPLSRREFLYYLWGASMAVFLAGAGGATIWFALPRFREGEYGGIITLPISEIPQPDSGPKEYAAGRFWLVNLGDASLQDPRQPAEYPIEAGVKALYKVCVHLGCIYKWVPTSDRFECPCHGSKYLKTGARIAGPARRNLDTFLIQAVDAAGNVLAESEAQLGSLEGSAISILPGTAALRIDTGRRIQGAPNSRPGGGS